MAAAQKLSHLLQLADQGPLLRTALAEEVAELLTDWPADYPDSMKSVCEALLAKTARDVDAATRSRLRVRLYADPQMSARVLGIRQSASHTLIAAVRQTDDALVGALAQSLGVNDAMARHILQDDTGTTLAAACKGASLDRAAFSALALLAFPGRDREHAFVVLDAFDAVPLSEATRLLRGWRGEQSAA